MATTTAIKSKAKPKPLSKAEADRIGREYEELMALKARTDARMTEIQERFRESFDLGPHAAGNLKVRIDRNVTRDDAAFMAAYPFEQFPEYYAPKIDTAEIKKNFAPAVLERFQKTGANKVVITVLKDDE